jgi:hypothetical protein
MINQHPVLNNLLSTTNPLTISKAEEYGFNIIDLNQYLKNYLILRASDRIHWKSEGHRMMTQQMNVIIGQGIVHFIIVRPIHVLVQVTKKKTKLRRFIQTIQIIKRRSKTFVCCV